MFKELNVKKYKQLKDEIKNSFLAEKLGIQESYANQSTLFKPMLDHTQTENSKLSDNINQILLPLTNELRRANDDKTRSKIREAIQNMSGLSGVFSSEGDDADYLQIKGKESSSASSSELSSTPIKINLDRGLNDTDLDNLESLELPLPSTAYETNRIDQAKNKAASKKRSLAQEFRADRVNRKTSQEIEIYESQKSTLHKYENILKRIESAQGFAVGKAIRQQQQLVRRKLHRGRPKTSQAMIVYKNSDDLIKKLSDYLSSYHAGNTGVYNTIISMLDELLSTKNIDKDTYDIILKNNNLHI